MPPDGWWQGQVARCRWAVAGEQVQVARWAGGQVGRWPGGQVGRWAGGQAVQVQVQVQVQVHGGWRMEDGGWRMEDGGWRREDGGWMCIEMRDNRNFIVRLTMGPMCRCMEVHGGESACASCKCMLEVQVQEMEVMEEHAGACAVAWIYSMGGMCMEVLLPVAWRGT